MIFGTMVLLGFKEMCGEIGMVVWHPGVID